MKADFSFGENAPVRVTRASDSIQDLLARANALLKDDYLQESREFYFIEPITPHNYKIQDVIINFYLDIPPVGLECPDSASVVIHGHERGKPCQAPYYCHIYGYSPTGAEHPGYISQFNLKWRKIYESKDQRLS